MCAAVNKDIILASGSPRRIEMMKKHGYSPLVMPADIDEALPCEMGMEESVMFLALKKALFVEKKVLGKNFNGSPVFSIDGFWENPLIIAADTIVYFDALGIIGKPKDKIEAFNILKSLNGNRHYVATGVAIIEAGKPQRKAFCEVTEVQFNEYTDEDILAYVNTDEPYDKAGGYAIQGAWGAHVDYYKGDYDNIVGFPWTRIEQVLSTFK